MAIAAHLLTPEGERFSVAELIMVLVEARVSLGLGAGPRLWEKWTEWKWKRPILFVGFLEVPTATWALFCLGGVGARPRGRVRCPGAVTWFVAFLGNQASYVVAIRRTPNAEQRDLIG